MPVLETLSNRALNRALLARQMLLERQLLQPIQAIERLAGMQAQQARPPFVGIWTRLAGFEKDSLSKAIESRKVVRALTLRGTLHLLSAKDFASWRPALQPMLTAGMSAVLRDRVKTFDPAQVLDAARQWFEKSPCTFTKLRNELIARFPDGDERAMGYFVRTHLPLVSVPDSTQAWMFSNDAEFGLAKTGKEASMSDLVMRYLAAFGPATAADFQAWSGFKGAQAAFDGLKPKLRAFQTEKKKVLFDLPDGPRPNADTPAPVRFIADFDNLILGHADRTRIIADEYRPKVVTKNLLVLGTFLVDGFVEGTWKMTKSLEVNPFGKLAPKAKAALETEGHLLTKFLAM